MSEQTEFHQYVTPDGLVYNMHDRRSTPGHARWVSSFSGQGMPGISLITQRGPYQNGETVLDYRLKPRTITYLHGRGGCTREEYWAIRSDQVNYMRPNRQAAGSLVAPRLRAILPNGSVRDIEAWLVGGLEFAPRRDGQWREDTTLEPLRFYCPDPVFFDPTAVTIPLDGAFCADLIFPFDFPLIFCNDGSTYTDLVTYGGTWLTYPTFELTGPLSSPIIYNATTNEKIQLNYDIPAGRTVTISLAYGAKSVSDNAGNNLIGTVTTDSSLATWHLAADPEALAGVNQLAIVGYNTTAASAARMTYYTRYIGI